MLDAYRDHIKDISNCLIRAGIRLPVNFDGDMLEFERSIGVLEDYLYFNDVLSVSDSGYKIPILDLEPKVLFTELMKKQFLPEFEERLKAEQLSLLADRPDPLTDIKETPLFNGVSVTGTLSTSALEEEEVSLDEDTVAVDDEIPSDAVSMFNQLLNLTAHDNQNTDDCVEEVEEMGVPLQNSSGSADMEFIDFDDEEDMADDDSELWGEISKDVSTIEYNDDTSDTYSVEDEENNDWGTDSDETSSDNLVFEDEVPVESYEDDDWGDDTSFEDESTVDEDENSASDEYEDDDDWGSSSDTSSDGTSYEDDDFEDNDDWGTDDDEQVETASQDVTECHSDLSKSFSAKAGVGSVENIISDFSEDSVSLSDLDDFEDEDDWGSSDNFESEDNDDFEDEDDWESTDESAEDEDVWESTDEVDDTDSDDSEDDDDWGSPTSESSDDDEVWESSDENVEDEDDAWGSSEDSITDDDDWDSSTDNDTEDDSDDDFDDWGSSEDSTSESDDDLDDTSDDELDDDWGSSVSDDSDYFSFDEGSANVQSTSEKCTTPNIQSKVCNSEQDFDEKLANTLERGVSSLFKWGKSKIKPQSTGINDSTRYSQGKK